MSLILNGTDGLSDVDGTAGTPAIRGTDANTGIFFGSDIIGFSEGGAEVARFNADAQFVAAAGTALLPVITTTGDVNTGIFFPAADTIAFSEGGSESMRINSSGNVGIGTNNPTRILDIAAANPGGGGGLRVTATTGTNGALMQVSNTGGNFYHAIDTSAGGTFGSAYSANIWYDGNYPMRFATNNQVQMAITGAGLFQMNSGYGSVATAFGCRAWINFNGTGTPAIRASGNVTSITDNGTGDYTVNFTTAFPDTNYCPTVGGDFSQGATRDNGIFLPSNFTFATDSLRISTTNTNGAYTDIDTVLLSIFR